MDLKKNREITLEEMLNARERRVFLQNALIRQYHTPIISFTLNIPGPQKVFHGVPEAFDEGCAQIRNTLAVSNIPLLHTETIKEGTGYEAFFAVNAAPLTLKQLMTALENKTTVGRLYDIDIIKENGEKVSREEIGLPSRTCLLCDRPAHECSRSRRHSVEELILSIKKML